jgi:hypothetical protein
MGEGILRLVLNEGVLLAFVVDVRSALADARAHLSEGADPFARLSGFY